MLKIKHKKNLKVAPLYPFSSPTKYIKTCSIIGLGEGIILIYFNPFQIYQDLLALSDTLYSIYFIEVYTQSEVEASTVRKNYWLVKQTAVYTEVSIAKNIIQT